MSGVWRAGGILADDQTGRILDLYETSTRPPAAGVHWPCLCQQHGRPDDRPGRTAGGQLQLADDAGRGKLAVIFGGLVGSARHGFWLRFGGRWRLSSEIVFFLACLLYGAAIWLIAQMFHIQSHYPDGIWFWALGVLPFALCLDTLLLHVLYAGLLAIWVGTEILGFPGMGPWLVHGLYVAHGALTLPLLALPGLLWAYRKRSALTIGIYAPLLAWWAVLQPVAWQWEVDPALFCRHGRRAVAVDCRDAPRRQPHGHALSALRRAASRRRARAVELRRLSCRFAATTVRPATICRRAGDRTDRRGGGAGRRAVAATRCGDGRLAARDARLRRFSAGNGCRWGWCCCWRPMLLERTVQPIRPAAPYATMRSARGMQKWSPQVLLPVAAVNAAMIVLALWLMRLGLREDRTWPFAAGVLYFLLWAVLRYVDLFAGVGGMLGAALMFLLCGVGLLAVARFWLHRKESDHV